MGVLTSELTDVRGELPLVGWGMPVACLSLAVLEVEGLRGLVLLVGVVGVGIADGVLSVAL